MLGAIIGDVVGSIYEFDNIRTKEFPLFQEGCEITDDSIMTDAIACALRLVKPSDNQDEIKREIVAYMRKWYRVYPCDSYGTRFLLWLANGGTKPYNSYGNGSAMRVSPCAWLYDDIFTVRYMARMTAEVTHNHIEGVKGAEAVASAIFLARKGNDKETIKRYIVTEFGYNLDRTLDEIRPTFGFYESCQRTVPEAITAFLEGTDFEDCIRNAISLGGDSDTIACITGSVAEAFYGIPEEIVTEVKKYVPAHMMHNWEEITCGECNRTNMVQDIQQRLSELQDNNHIKK